MLMWSPTEQCMLHWPRDESTEGWIRNDEYTGQNFLDARNNGQSA